MVETARFIGARIEAYNDIQPGQRLRLIVRSLSSRGKPGTLPTEPFLAEVPRITQSIIGGVVVLKGGSQIPISHLEDPHRIVSVRLYPDGQVPTVEIHSLQRRSGIPTTEELMKIC